MAPRLRALALLQALLLSLAVLGGTAASAETVPLPAAPSNLPPDVETFQPYVGQSTCDPVAKPGVRAFANLLLDTYTDTTSLGIVRDCGIGGQSEHKEGRAFDWGVSINNPHQVSEVNTLLGWLLRTDSYGNKASAARRFGIMYMIWNKQIWKAYAADKGWQPYSGESEHTDHVHFSFGWSGANKATSWWTGKVAPTDYGSSGKGPVVPVADPDHILVLKRFGATTIQEPPPNGAEPDAEATTALQKGLQIPADGQFGPGTTAAVKAFQDSQSLPADGVVNPDVWKALFPVPVDPFGSLESAVFGIPGTVVLKGWAEDVDTQNPLRVHVYVDGALNKVITAGDSRPEIEQQYPGSGPDLGYTTTVSVPDDGVHEFCTYGINVGNGTNNSQLGCLSVNVRHMPYGHADAFTVVPGAVVSRGWVYDPDTADTVQVVHTVDGQPLATVPASASRPDVGSRYPAYGSNRGYSSTVDLSTVPEGSHTLCDVATNLDAGTDFSMACTTTNVRHDPFGAVESLTQTPAGLALSGWAIEPDVSGPAAVTGTLDGKAIPDLQATVSRPDLATLYPVYGGAHGFTATLPAPAAEGSHTLCVTIANVGAGSDAAPLCRSVTVTHTPTGRFDVVSVSQGQVTVRGWALDPDTASAILVHVRVDGALVGRSLANQGRSDVAHYYPAYGAAHGYRYTAPKVLAKGTHTVCVYAINTGAGSGNPQLACRKVTVR